LAKRNKTAIMVQLENYKADNERLWVYKGAKEFKGFAEFSEAWEGVRSIKKKIGDNLMQQQSAIIGCRVIFGEWTKNF
jgi:hypothetical protein